MCQIYRTFHRSRSNLSQKKKISASTINAYTRITLRWASTASLFSTKWNRNQQRVLMLKSSQNRGRLKLRVSFGGTVSWRSTELQLREEVSIWTRLRVRGKLSWAFSRHSFQGATRGSRWWTSLKTRKTKIQWAKLERWETWLMFEDNLENEGLSLWTSINKSWLQTPT